MAKIERFEDLEVWNLARLLASKIYRLTNGQVFARDFGLRDQIRRAAVSIVSNIAEGFGQMLTKLMQYLRKKPNRPSRVEE